jgi:hypothetical protein
VFRADFLILAQEMPERRGEMAVKWLFRAKNNDWRSNEGKNKKMWLGHSLCNVKPNRSCTHGVPRMWMVEAAEGPDCKVPSIPFTLPVTILSSLSCRNDGRRGTVTDRSRPGPVETTADSTQRHVRWYRSICQ